MFWSFCYLMLRRVLQLAALRFRSDEFKELEIVVLRHELAVPQVIRVWAYLPVMTLYALHAPDDLLALRFACSPVWETQAAAQTIADERARSDHEPWHRLVRERVGRLDLTPLLAVQPIRGFVPDFLTPRVRLSTALNFWAYIVWVCPGRLRACQPGCTWMHGRTRSSAYCSTRGPATRPIIAAAALRLVTIPA